LTEIRKSSVDSNLVIASEAKQSSDRNSLNQKWIALSFVIVTRVSGLKQSACRHGAWWIASSLRSSQ
jgi:hypothetical protein